jgi:hypothetical protein
MNFDKLDNPAWYSLSETHSSFAIGDDEIKFYKPDICSFGGINSKHADLISFLKKYTELDSFYIIGESLNHLLNLLLKKNLYAFK